MSSEGRLFQFTRSARILSSHRQHRLWLPSCDAGFLQRAWCFNANESVARQHELDTRHLHAVPMLSLVYTCDPSDMDDEGAHAPVRQGHPTTTYFQSPFAVPLRCLVGLCRCGRGRFEGKKGLRRGTFTKSCHLRFCHAFMAMRRSKAASSIVMSAAIATAR